MAAPSMDASVIVLDVTETNTPLKDPSSDESFFKNLPEDLSRKWVDGDLSTPKHGQEKLGSPITPSVITQRIMAATGFSSEDKKLWQRGVQVLKRNNVTPTPDFKSMSSPLIKAKLKQNGFRICARRKAMRLLSRAYRATHPYLSDNGEIVEASDKEETPRCAKGRSAKDALVKRRQRPRAALFKDSTDKPSSGLGVEDAKGSEKDDSELEKGENENVPEESLLIVDDKPEESQSDTADLRAKLFDCFRSNESLYKRILCYQVMPLKLLQQAVRDAGIRCSMLKLIDFLDSQCITFTIKDEETTTNGVQQKQKKTGNPKRRRNKK